MSVVEIHLPNGWCTSVRTSDSTTVQNLLDVVAKKFCGRGVDGSDSRYLSACFLQNGKTQWLQKNDFISKLLPSESPVDSVARLKLDVTVRFFPANLSDLSQQVLRLLFEQVFKVYIGLNERIPGDPTSQPDPVLLLELGCLQMRRVLGDCPPEAVYSKANMRYLEKQVGLSQFFPQVLLSRYSPTKLSYMKKIIRNNLRQFSTLSADECTLRFLELLNRNYVFTDETFGHLTLGSSSTTDGPDLAIQRVITLRIGPTIGLACVRSTGTICELSPFAQLDSAEVVNTSTKEGESRPLLRIKTLDGDSLTLSCRDQSQASAIVSLLDGYSQLFCSGRSLLPPPTKDNGSKGEQASASSGVSSNAALDDDEITFEVVPFKSCKAATSHFANGRADAVTSGFATVRKHPRSGNNNSTNTTKTGNAAINLIGGSLTMGRSRSNSDLRAPRNSIKSNAQTQTVNQNTQTETASNINGTAEPTVVSKTTVGGSTSVKSQTPVEDIISRSRNATAAWLARDRTPDSTPPQLSYDSAMFSTGRSVRESNNDMINSNNNNVSYATVRRHPNTINASMLTSSTTTTATHSNAVGWKHSSPVDDYIELFEPDVEIDRNRLEIGLLIGEGQFGDVFEGEYRPNGKDDGQCISVAVKMCKSGSDEALGDFLEEACLFRQLAHPYIITLVGVSTSSDPLLILTELAPLGPLRDFLTKERDRLQLNLVDLLTFAAQAASALAYLHSRRLVHRDVAARNVLVFSRELGKLADFGLARRLPPDAESYTATGGRLPVKWLAPESVNFRKFSRASDVWMLGIFLWEVTTFGQRPWPNVRNADYPMLLAVGARLPRPEPTSSSVFSCPPSLYSLMLACWADQPPDRPGCDQIFNQLLAIREEVLAMQKSMFIPPPKPPISEPQQPSTQASSSSLALEQATLWLLDSVATLAPPGPLLASPTTMTTASSGPKVTDSQVPFVSMATTQMKLLNNNNRSNNNNMNNMTTSKYQEGKQFIVPVVAESTLSATNADSLSMTQSQAAFSNGGSGEGGTLTKLSSFVDSLAISSSTAPSPSGVSSVDSQRLYDHTLAVVRCVFTLNKELERVGSDSPPILVRILDLASAVCSSGRNLLTSASAPSFTNAPSKPNNVSEASSLALLRANLGAHIRSVLAAIRPLSSLPTGQQLLPPNLLTCRQLAEAAAGVAVAARLLLARSLCEVPNSASTSSNGFSTGPQSNAARAGPAVVKQISSMS